MRETAWDVIKLLRFLIEVNMRKGELAINALFVFGPFALILSMLIGVNLALNWPVGTLAAFSLFAVISISLLIYAKLPGLRSGRLSAFGVGAINQDRRKYYYLSYVCLLASFVCTLGMMMVGKL